VKAALIELDPRSGITGLVSTGWMQHVYGCTLSLSRSTHPHELQRTMLDSLPQVQYLALVPALYLGYRILGQRRRDAKFPTGPSGLPWIGNLWDIPPAFAQPGPFLYYRDLVSTFGVSFSSLSLRD
jgi:hypothetical protein